jgi:hypothetical protein
MGACISARSRNGKTITAIKATKVFIYRRGAYANPPPFQYQSLRLTAGNSASTFG